MLLLYDFIIILLSFLLLPIFWLWQLVGRRTSYELRERFGCYQDNAFDALKNRRVVWMHAASVGETNVALLLARQIKEEDPDKAVFITNMTTSGLSVSRESCFVDCSLLFPVDLSFIVKKLLNRVRPELILVVETEIWPNFSHAAAMSDIPIILVNGRLSDRSYPRYRVLRMLLKPILQCFTVFCMQSQEDAERVTSLGASREKVVNTGNLKFDFPLRETTGGEVDSRKKLYRLPESAAVMVAGSTHDKEEKLLVEAYREIQNQIERDLIFIMIPRYPERKQEILKMIAGLGERVRLRSSLGSDDGLLQPGEILLVDSLGEVLDLYSVADIVFVGGSLVPVGGHNLLEASLMSKPVLFGPHVQNFKEISSKLIRAGAGIKVRNVSELQTQSVLMLNDLGRCRAMGEAGRSLIVENSGATERTMSYVSCLLR